ncbi:CshA/CshB family fibrillar adhesin-related protein [Actinomyces sp. B33]|uniref:CshA/CshB family fibrillar adhesin-related protein n=1 Tax=Actinomyces sp. B33 TaxID=2942131 RepID=UPI002340C5D4|nr:CshA/CshB family fibrillar adhesin-related protein [Actinomyces sp. B33]MDC4233027.1 CshA/CshB family fibrillar adhesin-related protein [Actinomyces sp. B33]
MVTPGASEPGPAAYSATPRAPRAGELPAVFATGGTGRFKESIQWLQWADYSQFENNPRPRVPVLDYGQTKTFTNARDLGEAGTLVTTCQLSDLDYIGSGTGRPAQSKAPLVATIPGTWAGDALDNMYNVGGAQYWKGGYPIRQSWQSYPDDLINPNQMVIGLANGYAYVGDHSYEDKDHDWTQGNAPTGLNARVRFTLSCTATLNGKNVPLEGLVFADAEASSDRSSDGIGNSNNVETSLSQQGWKDEWIQVDTLDGIAKFRVLDTLKGDGCPITTKAWIQGSGGAISKLRFMPTGEECAYQSDIQHDKWKYPVGKGGPDVVTFMEGATKARITIQGAGYSAVALGLVIATDFGDAPASYGKASSLFQPTWEDGQITSNGQDMFGVGQARMRTDKTVLGTRIDAEGEQQHSDNARGDDDSGSPDDEDAVEDSVIALGISTQPGALYDLTVACMGPGKVAGWIDWNHNGSFDSSEKSTEAPCSPADKSAVVKWAVPADVVRSVDNEPGSENDTYMRLRITNDNNGDGQKPTGNTSTGEVEDYKLSVRIPTLQIVKKVDAPHASEEVGALPPHEWALSGRNAVASGSFARVEGFGDTGIQRVQRGKYALSEQSTHADAAAYEAGHWTCAETPGTIRETGVPFESTVSTSTVTVANSDRVTCTITNSSLPGTLTWNKVDEDSATLLGGTSWVLTGPGVPPETVVVDCERAACPVGDHLDQDPAPGRFRLTNLRWGTYSIQERTAPAGYSVLPDSLRFTTIIPTGLEGTLEALGSGPVNEDGAVVNRRITGSVTWQKADESDESHTLSGSQWSLTGGASLPAEGVVIADCVASIPSQCPHAPNGTYYDVDPKAGVFKVEGLSWSDTPYSLIEAVAPPGYQISSQEYSFTITRDQLNYVFSAPFTNRLQEVPPLPLTGGTSTDSFLILGGAVGGLGVIAGAILAHGRRRTRSSR